MLPAAAMGTVTGVVAVGIAAATVGIAVIVGVGCVMSTGIGAADMGVTVGVAGLGMATILGRTLI